MGKLSCAPGTDQAPGGRLNVVNVARCAPRKPGTHRRAAPGTGRRPTSATAEETLGQPQPQVAGVRPHRLPAVVREEPDGHVLGVVDEPARDPLPHAGLVRHGGLFSSGRVRRTAACHVRTSDRRARRRDGVLDLLRERRGRPPGASRGRVRSARRGTSDTTVRARSSGRGRRGGCTAGITAGWMMPRSPGGRCSCGCRCAGSSATTSVARRGHSPSSRPSSPSPGRAAPRWYAGCW